MDSFVLFVFVVVYLGMMLGRVPGLALDRTGVALLGVIVLTVGGKLSADEIWAAVDTSTIALLLSLMVVSAQFRLSGFYSFCVRRLAVVNVSPPCLLALLIILVAILSALLANDIVCLAMTPVLVQLCVHRGANPKPFLLALACAANIGSAATLIGNPQNMLIGQVLQLPFGGYLMVAFPPTVIGLVIVWVIIARRYRSTWYCSTGEIEVTAPSHNRWHTVKGLAVLGALVAAFLFLDSPREIVALAGAGVLLCSRRLRSREVLSLVDWQLIILFIALFALNHAMNTSGNLDVLRRLLSQSGIVLENPVWLFGTAAVLSNIVSNVPAVMLLLSSAVGPLAGPVLALSSTLAGNLLIVGSIANIIVVEQAGQHGVEIRWAEHARIGIPVTILSLLATALWLWGWNCL